MKYHVVYTDGGKITLKSFDTEQELLAWVGRWHLDNLGDEDSWIDMTFYGNLGVVNPYIRVKNGKE